MSATRDVSDSAMDQRRATVAVMQLMELFGARGRDLYFAIDDAAKWEELLVWSMGIRSREFMTLHRGIAADAVEIKLGSTLLSVQGPMRIATMDDYRRWRTQCEQEGA